MKFELPESIRKSFDAWAGCVAGALEKNQYLTTIKRVGFKSVKIVSERTFNECCSHAQIKSVQVEAYKRTGRSET